MTLSDTESIFCQAIATTSLLSELSNGFLESEYYHNLHFPANNNSIKAILKKSGIGNPATLQMFLYVLLVMPKEILKNADQSYVNKCTSDFNLLCNGLLKSSELVKDIHTNYCNESEADLNSIDFYYHIRNAVSHSRCSYKAIRNVCYVTFADTDGKHICEFTLKTSDVGTLLEMLQKQIMDFLNMRWTSK